MPPDAAAAPQKKFSLLKRDVDMTRGSIVGNMIRFAVPLLLGNFLQQLYNLTDTWVIGQMDDSAAYAAVGNIGPVINILIGFFLGFSTGAGVVISQYYGKKDYKGVHDAVHTTVAATLVMALIFTVLGVSMTPLILRVMLHVDPSDPETLVVYPHAVRYLTIYFFGVSGLLLYNVSSGILRAVGDSVRPFIFLCISAVSNILLDFLFVFGFRWGVTGVALATVIAQAASAIFAVTVLLRAKNCVKVTLRDIRIDRKILGKIFRVGLPAAVQTSLTAFSNVFVQSYISGTNGIQKINMSSWTTYSKVDGIIFLPLQSLALAATTFVGQNLGAGNPERARKGTHVAYLMAVGCTLAVIIPVEFFCPYIAEFFQNDPDVVAGAALLLRVLSPFYLFSCVNQVYNGAMRGAGDSTPPMIIMLTAFVLLRQIYLFVMTHYISNDLLPVGLGYPFGWFMCMIMTLIYYNFFFKYTKKKVV